MPLREKIGWEPGKARGAIRRQCKSDPEIRRRKLGRSDLKIATQFKEGSPRVSESSSQSPLPEEPAMSQEQPLRLG